MKAHILAILCFLALFTSANAQPWTPAPLNNDFFKAMVGKWTGQSEMFGTKRNEEINCYMKHNGQFLVMDVVSKSDDGKLEFEGQAMYGINEQGNPMLWWFDSWGAPAVMTGIGAFAGTEMMSMTSGNAIMSDDRTIIVKGDEMTMDWKSTYKDESGKEHTMSNKTIYKRVKSQE